MQITPACRDVKADNILLTANHTVKVGDFGISKSLDSTMAQALTRIGTPYYLSPEVCMGKPYDQKNDIWALGVILYQLCTLKYPFDASNMEKLLDKITRVPHMPVPGNFSRSVCLSSVCILACSTSSPLGVFST